jgi:hypothetical protein
LTSSFLDQPPLRDISVPLTKLSVSVTYRISSRRGVPRGRWSLLPILNSLERHLPLQQATITQVEIEAAAEMWATTVHRSSKCLHVGKRAFVFHATNWLRLLGRLHEPRVEQPFAAEMGGFLQFCISERALAPDTIRHYRLYIGEFLIWLDGQGKTLRQAPSKTSLPTSTDYHSDRGC